MSELNESAQAALRSKLRAAALDNLRAQMPPDAGASVVPQDGNTTVKALWASLEPSVIAQIDAALAQDFYVTATGWPS